MKRLLARTLTGVSLLGLLAGGELFAYEDALVTISGDETVRCIELGAETVYVFTNTVSAITVTPKVAATLKRALIVGGGGGGGYNRGGGGGAGGMVVKSDLSESVSSLTVSVGKGGAGGGKGGDSALSFDSTVWTAYGGGVGGSYSSNGTSGGSGGGGGGGNGASNGGTASQPGSVTGGYGNGGGTNTVGRYQSCGGGGAGGPGGVPFSRYIEPDTYSSCGNGGDGLACDITGESIVYAGGGGGGYQNQSSIYCQGCGGAGGGGTGSNGTASSGVNGLGGGGGGTGYNGSGSAGRGGCGTVILRLAFDRPECTVTLGGYSGAYDNQQHTLTELSYSPADATLAWAWNDQEGFVHDAPAKYSAVGVYTNVVKVSYPGKTDAVATGIVEIVAAAYSDLFILCNDPTVRMIELNRKTHAYVFTNTAMTAKVTLLRDLELQRFLVVGGGGAGGADAAGGGGAGGLFETNNAAMTLGQGESLGVVIGKGGNPYKGRAGCVGGDTTLNVGDSSWTGLGGGGGGCWAKGSGTNGGSGGGSVGQSGGTAGTALQPGSATGGYGNDGAGYNGDGVGSGGGGAGGKGSGSTGGIGRTSDITGSDVYYAGGGGGKGGNGGAGGGGKGVTSGTAGSGTDGLGGGGGGSGSSSSIGGRGGCGTVIVVLYWDMTEEDDPECKALVSGYTGNYDGVYHSVLLEGYSPSGATIAWAWNDQEDFVHPVPARYREVGVYTNIVRATYPGKITAVDTGVVEIVDAAYSDKFISCSDASVQTIVKDAKTRIYVFTNAAESVMVSAARSVRIKRFLLVGGGGAGGGNCSGGGGAGGLVESNGVGMVVNRGYDMSLKVGKGGTGIDNAPGNNGENTTLTFGSHTITALGGGGGGTYASPAGKAGGCGGGSGGNTGNGGAATQPGSESGGYGNNGANYPGSNWGGGGGGAGAAGSGTTGGAGRVSDITGTEIYYAGGGGAGGNGGYGAGGLGGGGSGASGGHYAGTDGLGAGGGGYRGAVGSSPGGRGGCGTVILELETVTQGLMVIYW